MRTSKMIATKIQSKGATMPRKTSGEETKTIIKWASSKIVNTYKIIKVKTTIWNSLARTNSNFKICNSRLKIINYTETSCVMETKF